MTDTTANTHSDYPFAFSFNSAPVVRARALSDITVAMGSLNSTNFSSGGFGEAIPDGLIVVSPFTLEVLVDDGEYAAMYAAMVAKTIANCVISHTNGGTFTSKGWYKQVTLKGASADKPDLLKVIVTFQPTGEATVVS
jgi:hypothetical protein